MSILSFIKNWKDFSTIWAIIQPFILKLIKKKVPTTITKLYENLAKYTQPAIDSLQYTLKAKGLTYLCLKQSLETGLH